MMAEVGDKTFCLIIIFTISWANWNSVSDQDYIEIEVEVEVEVEDGAKLIKKEK